MKCLFLLKYLSSLLKITEWLFFLIILRNLIRHCFKNNMRIYCWWLMLDVEFYGGNITPMNWDDHFGIEIKVIVYKFKFFSITFKFHLKKLSSYLVDMFYSNSYIHLSTFNIDLFIKVSGRLIYFHVTFLF